MWKHIDYCKVFVTINFTCKVNSLFYRILCFAADADDNDNAVGGGGVGGGRGGARGGDGGGGSSGDTGEQYQALILRLQFQSRRRTGIVSSPKWIYQNLTQVDSYPISNQHDTSGTRKSLIYLTLQLRMITCF